MAFLHCHSCDWQQDDFWDDSYNPIRFLLNWENNLLNRNLEVSFTDDSNFIRERGNLTWREMIAQEIEWAARKVREMHFRTWKDFNADRNSPCPKCGEVNWDID